MYLFLDTEFTGLHQHTSLISIAMVCDNGLEFYAEFTDYNEQDINPWIEENVLRKLIHGNTESFITEKTTYVYGNKSEIRAALTDWLHSLEHTPIIVWADVLTYDWILFCELFGGAMHIPQCLFYTPMDISTLLYLNKKLK
ncbi:MAG: 3'-5' exoribonuclease [Bacteroidetes bacterium]|nr:3'-5' exoribonuclease [Bacteroidota bacterium]